MSDIELLLDMRCLQDSDYRDRGVGRLSENLVKSARRLIGEGIRITGIVDATLPALGAGFRDYLDCVRQNSYTGTLDRKSWFLELSPMTHDPLFIARLVDSDVIFKAAIVYDFIPTIEPDRYLPNKYQKIDYLTQLLWLSRYDHYFPISKYTSGELERLLRVPRHCITLTRGPVAEPFLTEPVDASSVWSERPYILVPGGGDERKNVGCAVRAHAHSRVAQEHGVLLVLTGTYSINIQRNLRNLGRASGGNETLIVFAGYVDDAELVAAYREAILVIVPSKAEGFSLPVVEAMAVGTLVLASEIPAHSELIEDNAYLFDPADPRQLGTLIDRALTDRAFSYSGIATQERGWRQFRGDEIAGDFWNTFKKCALAHNPHAAPSISRRARPQIAFLGPLPPTQSGVADYTIASFGPLSRYADVHAFTPDENPRVQPATVSAQAISALPHLSSDFDRVIGVVGNSEFHTEIFEYLLRYGGACIEHDNRLLGFYCSTMGKERAREVAARELGRPVEIGELESWLSDESNLEVTFLGELAAACEPICFHSRVTANIVRARFAVEPVHLPFSIYRPWPADSLTDSHRALARSRIGVAASNVLIASFGSVHKSKASDECIVAVEKLMNLGLPVELHFVGQVLEPRRNIRLLCQKLGVAKNVRFVERVDEATYRDYLLAADAAVQLRKHRLGGLSGALLDCIAAGLPTVANADLADAMDSPCYVSRVPDAPSTTTIADALAGLVERCKGQRGASDERLAFYESHNFSTYALKLCEALSLDVAPTQVWSN